MVEPSVLKDAYLVSGLAADELAQVASIATVKLFQSGQSLTNCGDPADDLLVILSGRVSVTTQDGDLLGEIGSNSIVGEIGLVDAKPCAANVTSIGPVSAAVFSNQELRRLMSHNRQWGFTMLANISRLMAARLRQSNARVDELCDLTDQPWQHPMG